MFNTYINTLIIYDTNHGNTKKVAEGISKSLKDNTRVKKYTEVSNEDIEGRELLIVGSPTIAFGIKPEIKQFLKQLPNLEGKKVISFDTRSNQEKIDSKILKFLMNTFGYASKPISKILIKKGGEIIKEPEGFLVDDMEGPLSKGELERASNWLEDLN
jgi:flavodoxin I